MPFQQELTDRQPRLCGSLRLVSKSSNHLPRVRVDGQSDVSLQFGCAYSGKAGLSSFILRHGKVVSLGRSQSEGPR